MQVRKDTHAGAQGHACKRKEASETRMHKETTVHTTIFPSLEANVPGASNGDRKGHDLRQLALVGRDRGPALVGIRGGKALPCR